MKIKYVHKSEPSETKIYDTEKSLRNNPFIHMNQDDFDKQELKHMESDKNDGTILSYEVVEDEMELN